MGPTWIKALLLSTLAVFAPIQASMVVALFLVIVDLAVGLLAAKKRKEPITSAGIRRTLTKIFTYETSIALGFLAEAYMLDGYLPIAHIITGIIAAAELMSILESLDELNGTPLFATVIAKLGSKNDDYGKGNRK